jgi:hypothetical protein
VAWSYFNDTFTLRRNGACPLPRGRTKPGVNEEEEGAETDALRATMKAKVRREVAEHEAYR